MNERIDAIFNQVMDEICENPLYRFAELVAAGKPWVSLTDEEIMEPWPFETRIELVRWLEAKLKEKNK